MPIVRFHQDKKLPISVEKGTNLMKAVMDAGAPVASSCHGEGVCAKCRMQIIDGMQNLSAPNETELYLKERNKLDATFRISCQVQVLGDVTIDASYW